MYGDLAFGAQMSHLAIQVSQHPNATNGAKGRTLALFGCGHCLPVSHATSADQVVLV